MDSFFFSSIFGPPVTGNKFILVILLREQQTVPVVLCFSELLSLFQMGWTVFEEVVFFFPRILFFWWQYEKQTIFSHRSVSSSSG